jgi:hypothetical protein
MPSHLGGMCPGFVLWLSRPPPAACPAVARPGPSVVIPMRDHAPDLHCRCRLRGGDGVGSSIVRGSAVRRRCARTAVRGRLFPSRRWVGATPSWPRTRLIGTNEIVDTCLIRIIHRQPGGMSLPAARPGDPFPMLITIGGNRVTGPHRRCVGSVWNRAPAWVQSGEPAVVAHGLRGSERRQHRTPVWHHACIHAVSRGAR